MAKTKYEIELETKLMKAWADAVYEHHLRGEAVDALNDLNCRAHSGYDFNADPDKITLKVGTVLAEQWPHFYKARAYQKASTIEHQNDKDLARRALDSE